MMTKTSKPRSRVSYAAELRADAKARSLGLVTISVTTPSGERSEAQGALTPLQCKFARWAAALLFCQDVQQLPDIESLLLHLIESHPGTVSKV